MIARALKEGITYRSGHTKLCLIYPRSSSALGAVYEGLFGFRELPIDFWTAVDTIKTKAPKIGKIVTCPVGLARGMYKGRMHAKAPLYAMLGHLETTHKWSRQKIAAWLAEHKL